MRNNIVAVLFLSVAGFVLYQAIQTPQPIGSRPLDSYGEPEPDIALYNGLLDQVHDFMPYTTLEINHNMQHFESHEFREWWEFMDVDLLIKLDLFRERWNNIVDISPAHGSLGRNDGDSKSYHNVDKYGQVRAVDIFPRGLTRQNAALAVEIAESCGFGGIGVYTDTKPSMMLHLDNRSGRGRWARIKKEYVAIELAYS